MNMKGLAMFLVALTGTALATSMSVQVELEGDGILHRFKRMLSEWRGRR